MLHCKHLLESDEKNYAVSGLAFTLLVEACMFVPSVASPSALALFTAPDLQTDAIVRVCMFTRLEGEE